MKRGFSSLENKNLKNAKTVFGGLLQNGGSGTTYAIKCNLVNEQGCTDTDYYNDDDSYISRGWLCVG